MSTTHPQCLIEEVCYAARANGLEVSLFSGHDSVEQGLNDPSHWERIEEELKVSISLAAKLSIPGVCCFSGTRMGGVSDAYGLALFIKGARKVIRYAEETRVNLYLAVLYNGAEYPGYMANTLGWSVAACEGVDSPRMKLLLDICPDQLINRNFLARLHKARPFLGHMRISENSMVEAVNEKPMIYDQALQFELERIGYRGYFGRAVRNVESPDTEPNAWYLR